MSKTLFHGGDEASGHHVYMNGYLPTAHYRRDMYTYCGDMVKVVGMYEKYGVGWKKRLAVF